MYLIPPSKVDVCGKFDTVTVTFFLHTDDFQLGIHNEKDEAHGSTHAAGKIPLHLHGQPASLLGNQLGGGHSNAFTMHNNIVIITICRIFLIFFDITVTKYVPNYTFDHVVGKAKLVFIFLFVNNPNYKQRRLYCVSFLV